MADYRNGRRAPAVAGGYALLVLGVVVFVVVANLRPPSFAGIWLILVTLPSSRLISLLPARGILLTAFLTFGGMAQAWLLWLALRGMRLSGLQSR